MMGLRLNFCELVLYAHKKMIFIALVLFVMVGCAQTAEVVPVPKGYDFSLTDTLNNKIQLTDLTKNNDSVTIVFFRGHF